MDIKKNLKWGIVIITILIALIWAGTPFVKDYLAEFSEQRVKESIQRNYAENKVGFSRLIKYYRALGIKSKAELEFLNDSLINGYLQSPIVSNTHSDNTFWLNLESQNIPPSEFIFLPDGKVQITNEDTMVVKENWLWNYEGTIIDPKFEKFIGCIGISKSEFDTLKNLVTSVECEAITTFEDGSFSLRYDGISMCQYAYFITNEKGARFSNYTKLGEGIYCGLIKSELFCGRWIFKK